MKKTFCTIAFLFLFIITNVVYSQVVINEISNSNGSLLLDEKQETHDWIEIFNSGSQSVNLLNYSLSDNPKKPKKWLFPNIVLEPYSFRIVYASGEDTLVNNYLHSNFKLSKTGEEIILSDANENIIDYYSLGELQNNHGVGRKPDGGEKWCLFDIPSPGKTNNNSPCYDGYEPDPVISLNSGFYSASQIVELYTPSSTGIIRYELDGGFPSGSASIYSSALVINSTKIVSAKCYSSSNRLPSNTIKRSYFINETNCDLPIFSITLDPSDLWDYNTGIYAMGPGASTTYPYKGANFWKDWEKLCHVEYFDKQKVKQFEMNAGVSIHGGYSRGEGQKSLRIKCKSEYGTTVLNYPLIPEKSVIGVFKSFNLRNGGQDYSYTRFRDAFMQRIMKDCHVDIMGYEPALVFLNGEYWGEYEIREQQDAKYIENNFGVPEDHLDLLTHKGYLRALSGTLDGFNSMHNFINTSDPQSSTFYPKVEQMLDLENFADYFIAQTYYSNNDWIDHTTVSNNIKLWRQTNPDGKWRYVFWDIDQASGLYGYAPTINNLPAVISPNDPNQHSDILGKLLKNSQFNIYFINRYADLMNTVFQYKNIKETAYAMRDSIRTSMPRHKVKWPGNYEKWLKDVDQMVNWHFKRLDLQRGFVQSQFNLPSQVMVSLETFPPNAGRIRISTIIPDSLPWKGVYYNGVPVTLTAIPNPGFTFENWGINGNIANPDINESITLNISTDDTFIAHFTGSAVEPKLTWSEVNYNSNPNTDAGDWIELHNFGTVSVNLSGWYIKDKNSSRKFEIPFGTMIPSNGYIVFSCDTKKFVANFPYVKNFIGQLPFDFKSSGDLITLSKYDHSICLSVSYSYDFPWPREANGLGRTLELKEPSSDLNLASNWFAGCIGGSPGIAYNSACITAVDEVAQSTPLKIAPNPATGSITVEFLSNDSQDLHFEMYDLFGVKIKQVLFSNNKRIIVDRDGLAAGIYIIKVGNSKGFTTKKIIYQ
ncbi:MAG: CotH kinase family protein [Bacteroidetes bacterium]|nr:CotH kinase family protein [Bacteroidota bacterium]HET6244273.1 CotH kinase family protein [Bacteroidia bacterium]